VDDFALLRAWQAGDRDAGDALVRRHFAAIYRFFRTKLDEGAEDLVQRTFLGAAAALDRVDADRSFRAYLFGIARNQLLLHLRERATRRDLPPPHTLSIADLEAQSPSGEAARREEQRVLVRALRRIPIDFQIAVELHYWEDLGIGEIAEVLGVPEGTVKSRLARAREQLGARLENEAAASTRDDLEAWVIRLRDAVAQP
jgi:RNA polymerase sigma-70 factor (ECF subfamily)